MARRSSSSRWSRPATGKQIAALKAHGNYDGKYYSIGRASQAIGSSSRGSATSGGSSRGGLSSGSVHSSLAASDRGPSRDLSWLLGPADGLDSLLQPALGPSPKSRLAALGTGPMNFLSQLLGVPDDLDSLVQVALGAVDPHGSHDATGDGPVESVLYTIHSDDSDPSEPRIVVEAEVVHDSAYDGRPSLQVRIVGKAEPSGSRSMDHTHQSGARPMLGYRPKWTPVLVRTPAELAEQMRIRWSEALEELLNGVDPRMATFLDGARGMESALAVLKSSQSPASKFVLLQGLMDPDGQIQYKGIGLDASTFAEQIRLANDGNEDALSWLEDIQREEVLTSLSEATGTSLAAEADFRLSRWHKQGMDLINAVTVSAEDAGIDLSPISLLRMRTKTQALEAENRALRAEMREKIASMREARPDDASLSKLDASLSKLAESTESRRRNSASDPSSSHGILEDWFFEETRIYLQARFRESLPGQFAAALTPTTADNPTHGALTAEVRRLAAVASTDLSDYSAQPVAELLGVPNVESLVRGLVAGLYGGSSRRDPNSDRVERIVQAVRRAIAGSEAAGDDDLGTLIVAQEVLAYAQWRRDELRARKQSQEAERRRSAAAQRARQAKQRADAANGRGEDARETAAAAENLEKIVEKYAETLASTTGSVTIEDPLPDSVLIRTRIRMEQASKRETAAGEWLAAAEEHERWATAEASVAATPDVEALLLAEREVALAEQADARAEQKEAKDEGLASQSDLTLLAEARNKFDRIIRDVRSENERRLRDEADRRRQVAARQAEERRQREEERLRAQAVERERQEAANRRQEDLNQRQQDRANAAKTALAVELERLLALPDDAPFWRRKATGRSRESLVKSILILQGEITGPLAPPPTRSKTWPTVLSRAERYLGTVKKLADYGAFVSLPAGADGLLRSSQARDSLVPGQLVMVEIVDIPYGKPIVLKRIPS